MAGRNQKSGKAGMDLKKKKGTVAAAAMIGMILCVGGIGTMIHARADSPEKNVQHTAEKDMPNIKFGVPSDGNYTMKVSENERFELMAREDGAIAVWDKKSGSLYESNPQEKDELATGINMTNLKSQLYLTWADLSGNVTKKNSQTDCVNKGWLTYSATADGGIRFTYEFQAVGITVPVEYHLNEKGLAASIVLEDLVEHSEETGFYLTSIDLLPFFGAANQEASGYLFVPDGSGALIYLNNDKASYGAYSQAVYGRDAALVTEKLSADSEVARLPVFGLKDGNHGFLAIITQGDTNATINAMTSGTLNSYNNVYASFQYRPYIRTTFLQGNTYASNGQNGDTSVSLTISPVLPELGEYSVVYNLMSEENLDYVDMAEVYREYLIREYGMEKNADAAFYLELLGGLETEEYVLGIKVNRLKPLTTFAQAKEILEQLNALGIEDMAVRYTGWQDGGMEAKIPAKVKFEGKLGGKSGFSKLVDYAAEKNTKLFMDFDFVNLYEGGNGVSAFSDAAQTVGSTPAYQYTYDYNLLTKNDGERWKILTPVRMKEVTAKMQKESPKLKGAQLSLSTLSNMIYSDFTHKEDGIDRADVKAIWEEILGGFAQEFNQVMADGANAYAFPYVTHIYNAPTGSSGYDIEDEEIPFYQIVLHGLVSCSVEPLNLSAVPQELVLKAVETGSSLSACLMYAENTALLDTKYDYVFSGNYGIWAETLSGYYKETKEFLELVAGTTITAHEKVMEDVYRTAFSNGVAVYVNYRDTQVRVNEVEIPAREFVYAREGAEQ